MKTDKNSQTSTPSGTLLQPEQAVSDKKHRKEFEIEFHVIEHKTAYVTIQASSLRDARRKAENMAREMIDNWETECDQFYIFDIFQVGKGGRHE